IDKQKVLKKTAWDFGITEIVNGKEEVGNGSAGVYTQIGIRQGAIDLFGIAPKLKLQHERIILAESGLNLTEMEIEKQVKRAWSITYVAKNNFAVYERLDSIFKAIKQAAKLRLETEASSRLEYLATINEANQVQIEKEQAWRDYLAALQRLNAWLGGDTRYTVAKVTPEQLNQPITISADSLGNHPALEMARQQVNVADAAVKERRSEFLPRLKGGYARQSVDGQTGFHSYEVGIQIPLFFGPQSGNVKSARIEREISKQNFKQAQLEFRAAFNSAREQYLKWLNSWIYYRDEALPLAAEQRQGSVTAYKEGAIDYVTFLQNIRHAVQTEIDSWNAFGNYLDSRYQLEYYLEKSSYKNRQNIK
ncbi:MAG TPA: TolC family protein, partial [Sunxiuqinia sp.]|nr:TolC family protein [Sunxiuqinia sp.]